jgi:hypothetical protein
MRKITITGLIMAFMIILNFPGYPQGDVVRIEFPAEMNAEIYHIIPCGEKGVLLFYQTKEFSGENAKTWNFIMYDDGLKELWRVGVPVVYGAVYQDYFADKESVYILFLNEDKTKSGTENMQITTVDLKTNVINHVKGILPDESRAAGFVIAGSTAIAGLNIKGDQAGLYFVDLRSSKIGSYLIETQDQNVIEDIAVDSTDMIDVVITNYLSRKQNAMFLLSFDAAGNLVNHVEVQRLLENKYLNTAKIVPLEPGVRLLIGTYRNFQAKLPADNEYSGIESAGFFITKFTGDQQNYMNFYNFMEFKSLNRGLTSKDYYRLQRKKIRENQEMSLDYALLVHGIRKLGDQFILSAEAYYPDYRTVSDISYDYWGRPVTQTYTVFEGYRYFNVILAGFTSEGEMMWDNNVDLNDVSSYRLETMTDYIIDQNFIVAFYNQGQQISGKVMDGNREVEDHLQTEIETPHAGDKIIGSEPGLLKPWYDNYFLCYGYQVIRNNLSADNNKRTVFYLNKIALE